MTNTTKTTPTPTPTTKPTTTTTKPQPYNRHPYRPNPNIYRRNRPRNYLCLCCFWSILIIILLLFITTIAGCILYLLYRPHRPSFSITSLKTSQFNLTTNSDGTSHLTSNLNLTLSIKNPNKKVKFYYNPLHVTLLTNDDTTVANGSFADPFATEPNNITVIRSSLYGASVLLEQSTVNQIKADLKKRNGVKLKLYLDTETQVKIESIRSKRVGIRIECEGIRSLVPKSSNSSVAASVADAKCNVDLRIKIWKWTFSS
ncbi:hypothetical protein QVD17_13908 [Tagetes erecta]|uniref:Late embryogenesis abundant protein LEA-2 subgroup domain-containing protein n=1 Tax=Tagetes erecta TaxID=13708 RepID=A0AAD8KXB3_TARER|nr:hypothetical protein QVD17_13908 [Tagetes erecta]